MPIDQNLECINLNEDLDYNDKFEAAPEDMVSYTEPRSLQDIKLMKDNGSLRIDPDFQRNIVWSDKTKSLFIDSLYRQLPIPSLCFSYDYKTRERMVIDGLQRISTILRFMSDDNFRIMDLPEIHEDIAGKTKVELENIPDGKKASPYSTIINVTIPITVLRGDFNNESNMEYLYKIFQRLNQGSMTLYPQEIRNCAYQGHFNNMIKELNDSASWKTIISTEQRSPDRMKNEERILRFFAFFDSYEQYTGAMTKFLDKYMKTNRNLSLIDISAKKTLFDSTTEIATRLEFGERQSWAIKEAILIGLAKNLANIQNKSDNDLNEKIAIILRSNEFSDESTKYAVFGKDKTMNRLNKAIQTFA
ncbi:MAG: DUF262 domain-containing protein [Rickettsiales bacterium]|nr:DUF262 domain-containing protein [Rickettsiales bacterium]